MAAALRWLDPRGRLSRRAYGRLFVRLTALSAALLCLAIWIGAQGLRLAAVALLAGIALVWLASLAQAVRRLHDRGRSGWWLAVFLILLGLSYLPIEDAADAYPIAVTGYALASLGYSLWFLFETLGRRGIPGPNRYGSAPLE